MITLIATTLGEGDTMTKPFLRFAATAALALAMSDCSSGTDNRLTFKCIPGQLAICPCADGTTGTQECSADGAFSLCICESIAEGFADTVDSTTATDAGGDTPSNGGPGGSDAGGGRLDTDTPPDTNLCGGYEPLFYDGVAAAPGDECECEGRLGCTDGGN